MQFFRTGARATRTLSSSIRTGRNSDMIAPASSRPARMKWRAFRRVGAAHDDCVWTTSGEGPLGWRSSQTCRLGQFSTHARFMSLGNMRSARSFHRGASSQGDRGSGCGDSGSGCSDARLCACSCSSRPLAGSPRGRCLLLLNPVLHDGELLGRASAVLKSQGPENWSRGRPGINPVLHCAVMCAW